MGWGGVGWGGRSEEGGVRREGGVGQVGRQAGKRGV